MHELWVPVRIDDQGRISAEGSETSSRIASAEGEYQWLSSSPDLLCLVRQVPSGKAAPAPRMALTGDANVFPLCDLIAFLSQSRWTGVIQLNGAQGSRSLMLKEGEVKSAFSDNATDRLGEILVRLGYVTRSQVDDALTDQSSSKLGKILVERGELQPHDLWRCMTQQVADVFDAMVLSREGVFVLIDQVIEERLNQNLQISTQGLLMDSIRKIDEMAHFRKKIPSGWVYVTGKRLPDGSLESDEEKILSLADGSRTVFDLGKASKMSEFDVSKIVFRLLEGGYASVSELPTREVTEPQEIIRAFNRIFCEIFAALASKKDDHFREAADGALEGVLAGLKFSPSGELDERSLYKRYLASIPEMGVKSQVVLRQSLSDVMFFLLFQSGEFLDSDADQSLSRRIKPLLASVTAP